EQCPRSFLIETPEEIEAEDLRGARRVGVTAGASTPNWLIEQVIARLKEIGAAHQDEPRGA
ncbi:MAG: 4-hydroxy-3-methylbut-2-enyl diphosphate reductase, partial [Pyrinomonadaceae bacterium]